MKKLLGITILSVSTLFVSPTYASESVAKACNQREAGGKIGIGVVVTRVVIPTVTGESVLTLAPFCAAAGPFALGCVAAVMIGVGVVASTIGEEVGGQVDGCGGPISNRLITPD